MGSGDLGASYLSAARKVSHIQNSGHGPVVSSSSADIVVLIRVIFEYARPDGQPRLPMPNTYTVASHRVGTPSEHLYLAATLLMTGPDALQRC